jgi:putative NADH-flavin reductase
VSTETNYRKKRVLVVGASKGLGLETVKALLDAGHQVRAFARSAQGIALVDPKLEKVPGDATNSKDIAPALIGIDVVVQALGVAFGQLFRPVHLFSDATRVLVASMEHQKVARLICVTGFGAGDSRPNISCLQRLPFRILLGRAYDDKDAQERLIKDSKLEWTIVRPGVLTDGKCTGRYRILHAPPQWRNGVISRADVAHFIVRETESQAFVRKTPVLIY